MLTSQARPLSVGGVERQHQRCGHQIGKLSLPIGRVFDWHRRLPSDSPIPRPPARRKEVCNPLTHFWSGRDGDIHSVAAAGRCARQALSGTLADRLVGQLPGTKLANGSAGSRTADQQARHRPAWRWSGMNWRREVAGASPGFACSAPCPSGRQDESPRVPADRVPQRQILVTSSSISRSLDARGFGSKAADAKIMPDWQ